MELIKHACDITRRGVDRVLDFLKPGVFEYEIGAEIIHEFLMNRATGFAYDPIIASGKITQYCQILVSFPIFLD